MSELNRHEIISGKRRAGVCLPLWSLLSEDSFESGDIHTLQKMIPWMQETGLTILQILPLNDCGMGSSPYSSISSFAIDPFYISLKLAGIELNSRKKVISTNKINKQRITDWKLEFLGSHFDSDYTQNKIHASEFIRKNDWLTPYLIFKYNYNKNKGEHWSKWENHKVYDPKYLDECITENERDVFFYAWLQMIAYEQLKETKRLFSDNNLFLKGDMPILTSGNSADVWENPHYFRLDLHAGAPPDAFSDIGQNWGFPVLNWEELEKDKYEVWKRRLQYQENFFHLYRIDHVIGMFRLWSIPLDAKNAKYGFFFPQRGVLVEDFQDESLDPEEIRKLGFIGLIDDGRYYFYWDFHHEPGFQELDEETKDKLFRLSFQNLQTDEENWKLKGNLVFDYFDSFTSMMPCAEDLGSVPGFVRDCLNERKMFGIDVIRWTRSFEDGSYIPAKGYRKNAISTLSTHDTSLVMEWWTKELKDGEKAYAHNFFLDSERKPGLHHEKDYLEDPSFILERLVDFAFSTNSQFSIQMMQDLLVCGDKMIFEDFFLHKINTPGTAEHKNWNYRFNFFVEDLISDDALTKKIRHLVEKNNRL
ncbi:4-alpha-glucanotransferase [Leptospira sp. GIMC2001]|uniref:4-alpha-glucanotransferase n=1 Tax=Leptospira sp. GIMC2001 TaxID=1513297 RepID=UPI00234BEEF6|nr:4-alpha-glucanotransferase [Leptospira sp. GIMC2001]WCL50878.1 4-alpha-glucanotransferase [Leptospira sp. GIMC2001]